MARRFPWSRRGPSLGPSFLLLAAAVVLFIVAAFHASDRGKLLALGLACFSASFAL